MNEKAIIRLVRSATLKINYAGHTILVDPVFADKGTLQSALCVYKSPRVHLVMPISEITEGVDMVLLTLILLGIIFCWRYPVSAVISG